MANQGKGGKLEPWYKVVTPRAEVREGRSFNPDEFAIALEQVVHGKATADYSDPRQFFSRTVFTAKLREHVGMALRRMNGETANTAPVLALVTQFGGGKTHTLTALYHLVKNPEACMKDLGVQGLLTEQGLKRIPKAKVAVFVGNAWDPQEGREMPWIDVARQLAGAEGVEALGKSAKESPPGTEALQKVFEAAGGKVLILFDETLNFINRHEKMAEKFYAFIHTLSVALTGAPGCVAIFSLPRSQIEMTPADLVWQDRITKVVKRVAKEIIANDESEIAEVVRRRLFEDLGSESARRSVAKAFADWCFDRRAQLPPEWTSVDVAKTDEKAKDHLRKRFEACYPFHPATLSVFLRKWQTLPQYQQTRGTLAMLAQWVSWAYKDGFKSARKEALITLGSAPLEVESFKAIVLGQLGEHKLRHAVDADVAGERTHAGALDADTKGELKDIHRRVGTVVFFESSGGMADKVALVQELRFALGEPGIDTTSIDNAVDALEKKSFYLRKVGREGYRFWHQPRLKKVVGDKRASLDPDEVRKEVRALVKKEFEKKASMTPVFFPADSAAVADQPKLTVVVLDPETTYENALRATLSSWTKRRASGDRLYPAALVWCVKKPGRELTDKVELKLAWERVEEDLKANRLGGEFELSERDQVKRDVKDAEEAAKDEVWASYRYVLVYESKQDDWLREPAIDIGAGHASAGESQVDRILAALTSEGLLSPGISAGYIERSWPVALKESGAWPLSGLRKAFLDGSLLRLIDPERALREKIVEFVHKGDFALASGRRPDGGFDRLWFKENITPEEVGFEPGVVLVLPQRAESLLKPPVPAAPEEPAAVEPQVVQVAEADKGEAGPRRVVLRVRGEVPAELWNLLGRKLVPLLRAGPDRKPTLVLDVSLDLPAAERAQAEKEIRRTLAELGLNSWAIE